MPPLFIAAVILVIVFFVFLRIRGKKLAASAIAEGNAFLEKNQQEEGVHTTASGLQYKVLEKGEGTEHPGPKSQVTVHYHGTLIDGKVFDSSVQRGTPAEFPVNGVIAGWTEALQMMGVGSKWRLYLPYNLAYGEKGAGGDIGPYQALIFDIELLDISLSCVCKKGKPLTHVYKMVYLIHFSIM